MHLMFLNQCLEAQVNKTLKKNSGTKMKNKRIYKDRKRIQKGIKLAGNYRVWWNWWGIQYTSVNDWVYQKKKCEWLSFEEAIGYQNLLHKWSQHSTAQVQVRIPPFELAVRIIIMEKQNPIKLIPKWSVERGKESHSQPTPKLALWKSASFYVSQGRRRRRKTHKFFEWRNGERRLLCHTFDWWQRRVQCWRAWEFHGEGELRQLWPLLRRRCHHGSSK